MTQPPGTPPGSPEPMPPPGQPAWPAQSQPPPAQYPGYQPDPPGYAPGQYPQPQAAPSGWRLRLWLLLLIPPFGITTWAAFLYIGIRARRGLWLAFAGLYAALFVVFVVLLSPKNPSATAQGVGTALGLLAWVGGGIHALAISGDAVRRIHGPGDPALEAARLRIQRRAQGRHLLATQPALATEIGLGRPDVPGADDYGLVDVNHVPAAGLTRLPGVTSALAKRIATERAQCGGFSSVEDLGMLLDLPPAEVDKMRDVAVFIPD